MTNTIIGVLVGAVTGVCTTLYLQRLDRRRKLGYFTKMDKISESFEQLEQIEQEPQQAIADLLGRFFTLTLWCFLFGTGFIIYALVSLYSGWRFNDITFPGSLLIGVTLSPLVAYPAVVWGFMKECSWLLDPEKRRKNLKQKRDMLEREASVDGIKLSEKVEP